MDPQLSSLLGPTEYMDALMRERIKQSRVRIHTVEVKLKCHLPPGPLCDLPWQRVYAFQWKVTIPTSRLPTLMSHPMVVKADIFDNVQPERLKIGGSFLSSLQLDNTKKNKRELSCIFIRKDSSRRIKEELNSVR